MGKLEDLILKQDQLEQILDVHIHDFNHYKSAQTEHFEKMIAVQQDNTKAINELTKSTTGMVEAWATTQGVVKAGSLLGKFIKWLSGVAIVGVGLTWLIEFFKSG